MLIPRWYGEIQAWTSATGNWLQSRLAQMNQDVAKANTIELVDTSESDIRQFIRELEQKKREVNQRVPRDTECLQRNPTAPGELVRPGAITRAAIDGEKAFIIKKLSNWSVALDGHITAMNRILVDQEKRIQTQTGGREAIKQADV